ncbi:hypothetical protein KBC77_03385 [Candidatus Saccharibacteria bacterium]|nr:hypothetical protein [Candidatus Saccharibacteria bacterium]
MRRGFDSPHPHQIRTELEIVALSGGFFFGHAQRRPKVFLGGIGKLLVIYDDFFLSHLQVRPEDFKA